MRLNVFPLQFSQSRLLNRWIRWVGLAVLAFSLVIIPIPWFTISSQATTGVHTATSELSPKIKAFLDTIAWAEGTANPNGYRMIFTGAYFRNFQNHPRQRRCGTYRGKSLCSDAAGRYQFLSNTWNRIASKLRLPDFSPQSQDKGAIELIREQGALADVEAGRWESAIYKVAPVWSSFPTSRNGSSVHGQPYKPIGRLGSVYASNLQKYQQAGSPVVTQAPSNPTVIQTQPDCGTALFGECVKPSSCEVTLFGDCI